MQGTIQPSRILGFLNSPVKTFEFYLCVLKFTPMNWIELKQIEMN